MGASSTYMKSLEQILYDLTEQLAYDDTLDDDEREFLEQEITYLEDEIDAKNN